MKLCHKVGRLLLLIAGGAVTLLLVSFVLFMAIGPWVFLAGVPLTHKLLVSGLGTLLLMVFTGLILTMDD